MLGVASYERVGIYEYSPFDGAMVCGLLVTGVGVVHDTLHVATHLTHTHEKIAYSKWIVKNSIFKK